MAAVEQLLTEPQFKMAVDALLALEVSQLVETFAAPGRDGGVDAELRHGRRGTDFEGHTAFQYKFVHPATDATKAVTRVVGQLTRSNGGRKADFAKIKDLDVDRYIVITNAPMPRGRCDQLHATWAAMVGAAKQLVVWDRSRLQGWLNRHPHLGWARSQALQDAAQRNVVVPLWNWTEGMVVVPGALPTRLELLSLPARPADHILRPAPPAAMEYRFRRLEGAIVPDPILRYARECAFRVALGPLHEIESLRASLADDIEHSATTIATELRDSKEWAALEPPHRNTELRLAMGVLETTFLGGSPPGPTNTSIEFGSHHVKLGGDGHPMIDVMDRVRRRLIQTGNPFEPKMSALHERVLAWRDLLWFPFEVGVDAPDPAAEPDAEDP